MATAGGRDQRRLVEGASFSGTTTDTLTVIKPAYALLKGDQFRCVVSDGTNPVTITTTATLTVKWSQFVSLSARALVGTGDQTLILGFVFAGGGQPTMVRGVGPGLVKGEANLAGQALANPTLQLHKLNTTTQTWSVVGANDDWGGTAELTAAMQAAGMGALDADSKDAVLLLELPAGLGIYTAQLSGVGETTGIGLVEIYEAP